MKPGTYVNINRYNVKNGQKKCFVYLEPTRCYPSIFIYLFQRSIERIKILSTKAIEN